MAENLVPELRLRRTIRQKLPTDTGKMNVSTDAVKTLGKAIDNYATSIIDEAVKANYSVIKPIDIQRGMNKFNAQEMKQALDALIWTIDGLVQLKSRIERYNIE